MVSAACHVVCQSQHVRPARGCPWRRSGPGVAPPRQRAGPPAGRAAAPLPARGGWGAAVGCRTLAPAAGGGQAAERLRARQPLLRQHAGPCGRACRAADHVPKVDTRRGGRHMPRVRGQAQGRPRSSMRFTRGVGVRPRPRAPLGLGSPPTPRAWRRSVVSVLLARDREASLQITRRDRPKGSARPGHPAAGRGCRSWWWPHRCARAVAEWCGYRCHVAAGGWRKNAERYGH
jgi:hypothetical protein